MARFDGHFHAALQKTRHQNVALRDRAPKSRFGRQFPHTETSPYVRNAATWWHFAGGPLQYALETDWLTGAAGFEPLHLEIKSAELHPASTGSRRRSGAPLIRDAQVRVPPPGLRVLANSNSNMLRFESRRPSQPVRFPSLHSKGPRKANSGHPDLCLTDALRRRALGLWPLASASMVGLDGSAERDDRRCRALLASRARHAGPFLHRRNPHIQQLRGNVTGYR